MDNSVTLFQKFGLVGTNYNFSELANAFLSLGYTSNAGNTYFDSVRFAEGIVIKEGVGEGYARTFLNSLRIYSVKDKTIIAEANFHCHFYSKEDVKRQAKLLLKRALKEAALAMGQIFNELKAEQVISDLINKAFSQDQRIMIQNQLKKYLN